jgi:hypothetical protein
VSAQPIVHGLLRDQDILIATVGMGGFYSTTSPKEPMYHLRGLGLLEAVKIIHEINPTYAITTIAMKNDDEYRPSNNLKGGRYTVLYDWNTYKVKEIYTTG